MKRLLAVILALSLAACSSISPDQAKIIAYERLSAYQDGPSMHGASLLKALTVHKQKNGTYLVELRDEPRNLLWAVIVQESGQSEITRMAIDG